MQNGIPGYEKFSDKAKRIIEIGEEEVQNFDNDYFGTEHILLGLVQVDGMATRVLLGLKVDLHKVHSATGFIVGQSEHLTSGEIGLTPRARKVIELAIDEAQRFKHHYIGTEHLLMGLLRDGKSAAAAVLKNQGLNLEKVRGEISRIISEKNAKETSNNLATPLVQALEQESAQHKASIMRLQNEIQFHEGRIKAIQRTLNSYQSKTE